MTPARAVYQLRVVDPFTQRHHAGAVFEFLSTLATNLVLRTSSESPTRVRLDIVDLRTNTVVKSVSEFVADGPGLAQAIGNDLDRLDAADFAKEWGIRT